MADWISRENKEPSTDCFFYKAENCVGFHKCKQCDFHNLEPTKSKIIARINFELKQIKVLGKKAQELERNVYADASRTEIKNIAYEVLDKFRGVQIMNGFLNDKFGFKIPDVGSFTVRKMAKRIKSIEGFENKFSKK